MIAYAFGKQVTTANPARVIKVEVYIRGVYRRLYALLPDSSSRTACDVRDALVRQSNGTLHGWNVRNTIYLDNIW